MASERAQATAQRIADEGAGTNVGRMAEIIDIELALEDLLPAIYTAVRRFDVPEWNREDWWTDLNLAYNKAIGLYPKP